MKPADVSNAERTLIIEVERPFENLGSYSYRKDLVVDLILFSNEVEIDGRDSSVYIVEKITENNLEPVLVTFRADQVLMTKYSIRDKSGNILGHDHYRVPYDSTEFQLEEKVELEFKIREIIRKSSSSEEGISSFENYSSEIEYSSEIDISSETPHSFEESSSSTLGQYPRGKYCKGDFKPVCGSDNVTYYDACSAEYFGVRIDHEGFCFSSSSSSRDETSEIKYSYAEECGTHFEPVCTNINKTYQNKCSAEFYNLKVVYFGECEFQSSSSDIDEPTSSDGISSDEVPEIKYSFAKECGIYFEPVCAEGGITYQNECSAEFFDRKILYEGECAHSSSSELVIEPPSSEHESSSSIRDEIRYSYAEECEETLNPVCGENGLTYQNRCSAVIFGVDVEHNGVCESSSSSSITIVSSSNESRILYSYAEECKPDLSPVCTGNGVTYQNNCSALLNDVGDNVENLTVGVCAGEKAPDADFILYNRDCKEDYDLVCGDDRQFYHNPCSRTLFGAVEADFSVCN